MSIKVMRDQKIIEVEMENLKKGDVISVYGGTSRMCTGEAIFNDEDGYYYAHCGFDLFSEAMIGDMMNFSGVELENGNMKVWARVGMSFYVPKEDYEKLLNSEGSKVSNLVSEWMQKGYGYSDGDSCFTDGNGHEIDFDMSQFPIGFKDDMKKFAIWQDHKVVGYIDLSEEQKNQLNSIKGIGIYLGFDKELAPEKYVVENPSLDSKMKEVAGRTSKGSDKVTGKQADKERG